MKTAITASKFVHDFFLLLHRACCYNYCLIQLMHLHTL